MNEKWKWNYYMYEWLKEDLSCNIQAGETLWYIPNITCINFEKQQCLDQISWAELLNDYVDEI